MADFPLYAADAKALDADIRTANADAIAQQERYEHTQDAACPSFSLVDSDAAPLHGETGRLTPDTARSPRTSERLCPLARPGRGTPVNGRGLAEGADREICCAAIVQASTLLLDELSSFLSTFQRDLSAVSNHISDLQGRSKTIEARLEARKVRLHAQRSRFCSC